ncbi:MAG TPA: AAA family ATPase [Mycobacteriales bacterium]
MTATQANSEHGRSPAQRFVVITGGPGSGKSTLIDALCDAGHPVVGEAGRTIIQHQSAIGGHALPWLDPELYAEMILSWEIRSYHQAMREPGVVSFDRGVTDVVGSYLLLGRPVPAHVMTAAETFRYHRRVFVAPPWPEIYRNDRERRQDHDEAVRTHDAMVRAYIQLGYELVTLPRTDVRTRVEFVLRHAQFSGAPTAEHAGGPVGNNFRRASG